MDMRDWLIVVGIVVLVGAAIDAFRRVRNRNRLQLKIDHQYTGLPEVDLSGELPGGGRVRVLSAEEAAQKAKHDAEAKPSHAQQEPSFDDDDLLGAVNSGNNARREPDLKEPERNAGDVDLLLDDQLQGVGAGAGDYLSKPRVRRAEETVTSEAVDAALDSKAEPQPEVPSDESVEPEQPLIAESDTQPVAVSEPQPEEAGVDDRAESEMDDPYLANIEAKRELIRGLSQSGLRHSTSGGDETTSSEPDDVVTSMSTPGSGGNNATDDDSVKDSAEEDISAESAVGEQRPKPTLGLAAAPTLDLNRPIPEILASFDVKSSLPSTSTETPSALASPVVGEDSTSKAEATKPSQRQASADDDDLAGLSAVDSSDDQDVTGSIAAPSKGRPRSEKSARRQKKERRKKPRPEVQTSFFDEHPDLAPEPPVPALARKSGATRTARKPAKAKEEAPAPDEVLVITVMAKHDPFNGSMLFKLVEACGLSFGKMSIFHRHEQANGEGPVQFSMVNAVHPGTFDPEAGAQFTTPGVTFFLTMSEPSKLMEAFDCMLATAQCVADNLEGDLRDEHRSSLRSQTIEHYRHKVRDFERRQLARRA